MQSKFIIFISFAILVQNSCALSSTVYGLSSSQSATFNKIDENQQAALRGKIAGFSPAFDILEKLSAVLISKLIPTPDDSLIVMTESLTSAKDSIDASVNSILLVRGRPCIAAETARISAKLNLDKVFGLIPVAIGVTALGDSAASQAQFEVIGNAAQQSLANLVTSLYNGLRTCIGITNIEILAAIEVNEKGSADGLRDTVNAVLNAMKRLAAASSSGTEDLATVISDIEEDRKRALIGIKADVENKFSALKALYLNNNLQRNGIGPSLISDQYFRIAAFNRFQQAIEATFVTIKSYLTDIALNLDNAGEDDLSPPDVAKALTAAKYKAGLRILVDSVLSTEADASSTAARAWEFFVSYSDEIAEVYYDVILSTQTRNTSYSELLTNLETLKTTTSPEGIKQFVSVIFDLIRNNRSGDDEIENELATLEDATNNAVNNIVEYLLDGVVILAKVSYGIQAVSEDDFAAIQTAETKAYSEIENFTYSISAARLILM